MPKKISWLLRIVVTAMLLFFIVWEVVESISEGGFVESMIVIFALAFYVTSWFNTKLTFILLFIFGLVLAVFTYIVSSESAQFKVGVSPVIGCSILAPIVYWILKRKK